MNILRRNFLKMTTALSATAVVAYFLKNNSESENDDAPVLLQRLPANAIIVRKSEPLIWNKLSTSAPDLIPKYKKAVIIGSGYGASVAAARLSKKLGSDLCVLERGKEFQPGDYPSVTSKILSQLRFEGLNLPHVSNPLGLFNITTAGGLDILSGNALGGGSNINANVILEPIEEVFKGTAKNINSDATESKAWPLQIEDFRPYFKKVRTMLKAERYRTGVWVNNTKNSAGAWAVDSKNSADSAWRKNLLNLGFQADHIDRLYPEYLRAKKMSEFAAEYKTSLRSESTDINSQLDYELKFPPLAVNLTTVDTGITQKNNHAGVPQRLCNQCGDCVTGCNTGAKNTLIMNYLPTAKKNGAELYSQVEVKYVEKLNSGAKYRIHYESLTYRAKIFPWRITSYIDTDIVVFAAGAVGSTALLLKSQKYGNFKFSETLGTHISGNGDEISAIKKDGLDMDNIGFGSSLPPFIENNLNVSKSDLVGPCITTKVDLRKDHGIMFQDAAAPSGLKQSEHNESIPIKTALNKLLIFLTMGYDSSSGNLRLTNSDEIKIDFPNLNQEAGHAKSKSIVSGLAQKIGGKFIESPRTKFKMLLINNGDGVPTTVHALGGCPMGLNRTNGTINSAGQIFNAENNSTGEVYKGLYVTCGAALPTSVGANPLLTISAFSERVAAYMIGEADAEDPQKENSKQYQII